ncbi:peptide deformylase [Candidatus Carsonella ruddii]|uniref:Peptide deformylase n=1 Tax=Candidatus Carsonella ruddii (Diaphorina cf. continua) TaxID=2661587 RepID=A0A7R7ABK5_CARRU|nr:peptide deformylase [Candidatus Carsonella ruddii (Diaphorina cf. continua)]BCG49413.1 peptide deformylase [Candidatus Carsonella ruddii (Diaphorina cf. continua)]
MLLKIINIKDKRIRIKSFNLIKFNKTKILFLIKRMIYTMYKKRGIGISSVQILYNFKIIIVDTKKKNKPLIMINSFIKKKNTFHTLSSEGCLSLPKLFVSLPRYEKIFVNFINIYNKKKTKVFSNITSRCIQHEIDHSLGRIISDYINIIIIYE